MKRIHKIWILSAALGVLTLAVCPASGYGQDASTSATAENTQAKSIQLVGARAALSKGIDAKKAKQGDPVTAKLQDDVKIPDATALPKNTVLLGHIDQVQPSENKGDSTVQVTFDKAQLKGGQQLPIKATIMQIAPPVNAMNNMDQAGGGAAMPGGPAASGSGGTSSSGGGGTQSAQASRPAPSMGSSQPDPSQQQASQQGVPGVTVQSDIHQQDSGTFTSKGKNVHLADGTQMQLAVAVIPAGVQVK